MATIVNQSNELWEIVGINHNDRSDYQLRIDAPELVYSRNVTALIRVTTDGRLYNTVAANQYIEFDDGQDQRDFKSVVTDYLDTNFLALKQNGDLYSGRLNHNDTEVTEFKLIDSEVEWITTGSNYYNIISVKGEVITTYFSGEVNKTVNLLENEVVVDVYPGVIVTDIRFIAANMSVKRSGRLIGCGIRIDHKTEPYLIIAEEVDGKLSIHFEDLLINRWLSSYKNPFLIDIHSECPWIDVVTLDNNNPCLLNEVGNTVELLPNGVFDFTKIPSYILCPES